MPAGSEFQVNTYTPYNQSYPSISHATNGSFVVVWTSSGQDGSGYAIEGQRYDATGMPAGTEFQVNSYTTGYQNYPNVSHAADGSFVVVWQSYGQDGSSGSAIEGQRYDANGMPVGTEFQVNSYTTSSQSNPIVSHAADGSFVVVWQSNGQDGLGYATEGQRYDDAGAPAGNEFQVNTYTTGYQGFPSIAHAGNGSFVVVWHSDGQDGSNRAIEGQRFCPEGDTGCLGLIFADGFESGDTSAWSSSVP